jgi:hypothetical protein
MRIPLDRPVLKYDTSTKENTVSKRSFAVNSDENILMELTTKQDSNL